MAGETLEGLPKEVQEEAKNFKAPETGKVDTEKGDEQSQTKEGEGFFSIVTVSREQLSEDLHNLNKEEFKRHMGESKIVPDLWEKYENSTDPETSELILFAFNPELNMSFEERNSSVKKALRFESAMSTLAKQLVKLGDRSAAILGGVLEGGRAFKRGTGGGVVEGEITYSEGIKIARDMIEKVEKWKTNPSAFV